MTRHLAPTRRRIVGGADRLEQHLEGTDTEREHERAVAVVGEEPVVTGAQVASEAQQQRLVARTRDLEERAVLLAQRDLAVIEAARYERQSEIGDGLGEEVLVGALDHAHVAPFLIALCAPARQCKAYPRAR